MTYLVTIQEIHSVQVEVEADSKDKAQQKANQMIVDDEIDCSDLSYSNHVESTKWPVVEI